MKLSNKQVKAIVTRLVRYNPETYHDRDYSGDIPILDKKEFINNVINSLVFKKKIDAALTLFGKTGYLQLNFLIGDLLWDKRFIATLPNYKENLKKVKTATIEYRKRERARVNQIEQKKAVKLLKSCGYRVDKVKQTS